MSLDHSEPVEGHWRTGLANALDGSEDGRLARDARQLFFSCGMAAERARIVAQVRDDVREGKLSWENLYNYVLDPEDPGVLEEGHELQDGADEGGFDECLSDDEATACAQEADIHQDWAGESDKALVAAEPGDHPDVVAEAEDLAQRLAMLGKMSVAAAAAKLPQVQWHCDRQRRRIEKAKSSSTSSEGRANAVLKRFLQQQQQAEQARFAKARQSAQERRRSMAEVKKRLREKKLEQEELKERDAERKEKLRQLPREFPAETCGQGKENGGGPEHMKERRSCLDRLKFRSPALPEELELEWQSIRDFTARHVAKEEGKRAGFVFINQVNGVIKELGKHILSGADGGKCVQAEAAEGDPKAFERFVAKWRRHVARPRSATAVHL